MAKYDPPPLTDDNFLDALRLLVLEIKRRGGNPCKIAMAQDVYDDCGRPTELHGLPVEVSLLLDAGQAIVLQPVEDAP